MRTALALLTVAALSPPLPAQTGFPAARAQPGTPVFTPPNALPPNLAAQPLGGGLPVPGAPAADGNVVTFDGRQAQVRWEQGRWQIHAAGTLVKDFGSNQQDARDVLRVIRQLQLTGRGTVGRPVPVMEYWLSDGQAPAPLGPTLPAWPMDLATLRVQEIQGHWCLLDNRRLYFNFGHGQSDAGQALAVIRRYGFHKIAYVGGSRPAMIVLLGGAPESVQAAAFAGNDPVPPPAPGVREDSVQGEQPAAPPQQLSPAALQQVKLLAGGVRQLAAPLGPANDRLRFEPRELAVRPQNNVWKLFAGNLVLAEFGPDTAGAQRALQLLQAYRCNEQHVIGRPQPAVAYFLTNGQAPRGLRFGMRGRKFQPQRLKVTQNGDYWYLSEDDQPLLYVSTNRADAEDLLAAVRRHHFDFFLMLGQTDGRQVPFFVRS